MTWSFTKLSCWERCPAEYNWRYVEKRPAEDSKAILKGREAHSNIEAYLRGEPAQLPKDMLPMFLLLERLKDGKVEVEWKMALDSAWRPALWDSPDVWVRLVLDACEPPEADSMTVWEWKTGRHYPEHEQQRELYGLACLAHYPTLENVLVNGYYLSGHSSAITRVHREKEKELRQEWTERVGFMERDKLYAPKPSPYCKYACAYSKNKGGPCRFG